MKTHMRRLAAPRTWPIRRKGPRIRFITRPLAGPHTFNEAMPISVILTEILKVARTAREAKNILNSGKILVDGVVRKETAYPVGLMDSLSVGNEHYRMLLNTKGKLNLNKITKDQAALKPHRIINKTVLKGKKIQLNLFDGRNLIVKDDSYKVGDTLIISNNQIKKHLKFGKGSYVYLIGGHHIGKCGTVEEILVFPGSEPTRVIIKDGENRMEGLKSYAFVVEESFIK